MQGGWLVGGRGTASSTSNPGGNGEHRWCQSKARDGHLQSLCDRTLVPNSTRAKIQRRHFHCLPAGAGGRRVVVSSRSVVGRRSSVVGRRLMPPAAGPGSSLSLHWTMRSRLTALSTDSHDPNALKLSSTTHVYTTPHRTGAPPPTGPALRGPMASRS